MAKTVVKSRVDTALNFTKQAQKLSLHPADENREGTAVQAKFITPLDPVIETANGHRLPGVPVEEAHKLNQYRDGLDGRAPRRDLMRPRGLSRFDQSGISQVDGSKDEQGAVDGATDTKLEQAVPPTKTHPLFPPLPLYGPASPTRDLHCAIFRVTSFFLSTGFLLVVVLGAIFTSIPRIAQRTWLRLTFRDPDAARPFHGEEQRRKAARQEQEQQWLKQQRARINAQTASHDQVDGDRPQYQPTEGGPDDLVCDIGYYARRVGLDCEEFTVQTEDGFFISLYHVFDPAQCEPVSEAEREASTPEVSFADADAPAKATDHPSSSSSSNSLPRRTRFKDGQPRYPILLIHGLLQSAGAYCCNDDDSLAFYLCKAGYDVWLGNNRCGFRPSHALLCASDPRMWAWNIRQMGVMDLPAFVARVLRETGGRQKLGLVCHSQGTTQTFVALAKEQVPELGARLSVVCALAPAVYAGPLIGKMYFKFMRVISPGMFRVWFGLEAFIPLMMTMHRWLPGRIYGAVGYLVFSFLFDWSDERWDRGLRDRLFQFSPVYVSAESMRWWLGRECFAKHKCILDTREADGLEDVEDEQAELEREGDLSEDARGKRAWYDERVPPMALWVAGNDELVDGRRLLRRFERGREPHARIVHSKVIEEYEHLDVIWAMDAIQQVGSEVKQVLWDTMGQEDRRVCRSIDGVKLGRAGHSKVGGGDVEDGSGDAA